jgi:hypothetical protein
LRFPKTTINDPTVTDDEGESPPVDGKRTRPPWVLDERDISRIVGGGWWNDAVMSCALQFLQTLFDPHSVQFLDPISVNEPASLGIVGNHVQSPLTGIQRLPISPTAQLLFPLCVAGGHWVAVRVRPGRNVVDIFESKLNLDYFRRACEKVRSFYRSVLKLSDEPQYFHTAPIRQGNNTDCGPLAMIIIVYCAFDKTIDSSVNVDCCRRLFYKLLCEDVIDVEDTAEFTLPFSSMGTIARDPDAIEDYLQDRALQLEKFRRSIRRTIVPHPWTENGFGLVSVMQNAASTRADVPPEVLAGLQRASEYLERKKREETKFERIDALIREHYRLTLSECPRG